MNSAERDLIVAFRLENAQKTLDEVKILIENKLWNTAINRLYYACYYAVTALLILHEIQTHTHAGVRQMLALHFVKSGKLSKNYFNTFASLYEKRQTGDYEDFMFMTKEIVDEYYPLSIEFIGEINKLVSENKKTK